MNIEELRKALKSAGVPAASYSIGGKGRDDERLCLVMENGSWVVYYSERGKRTTELFFSSEEDACGYMFAALTEKEREHLC